MVAKKKVGKAVRTKSVRVSEQEDARARLIDVAIKLFAAKG